MAPKKKTQKNAAADASPKKRGQVKDNSENDDVEEEEDAEGQASGDESIAGINDADLAAPPPPRSCTVKASSSTASPTKSTAVQEPKSKKARLEAIAERPVNLDIIMLIVTKIYTMLQDVQTTVCSLQDKATRNTRSIVDLTQLSNRVNDLATKAETTVAAVAVKEEFKGKFAASAIDDKIVTKFISNALSFITMWPKVESSAWTQHKLDAFGRDVTTQSDLDQVKIFFFISCV